MSVNVINQSKAVGHLTLFILPLAERANQRAGGCAVTPRSCLGRFVLEVRGVHGTGRKPWRLFGATLHADSWEGWLWGRGTAFHWALLSWEVSFREAAWVLLGVGAR